jgi:glycerophosphoryl diester phosphodiesterase
MTAGFIDKCIAHRGLIKSGLIENSYETIIECIDNKVAIEVDLQFHPSGEIFVFHDENLLRMFGYNFLLSACPIENLKLLKYTDNSSLVTLSSLLDLVNG